MPYAQTWWLKTAEMYCLKNSGGLESESKVWAGSRQNDPLTPPPCRVVSLRGWRHSSRSLCGVITWPFPPCVCSEDILRQMWGQYPDNSGWSHLKPLMTSAKTPFPNKVHLCRFGRSSLNPMHTSSPTVLPDAVGPRRRLRAPCGPASVSLSLKAPQSFWEHNASSQNVSPGKAARTPRRSYLTRVFWCEGNACNLEKQFLAL